MRPPRMTTRRWMYAVMIVALVLGAFMMAKRRAHLQDLAVSHKLEAMRISFSDGWATGPDGSIEFVRLYEPKLVRLMEYHDALCRKYERAANHPWLPVERDPPPPR
jgi:hypothetical protein